MTEAAETEATALYTGYFSNIDEVVEHIKSADTLGLGFRLESYLVSSADEAGRTEFEFTLLNDMPHRTETED